MKIEILKRREKGFVAWVFLAFLLFVAGWGCNSGNSGGSGNPADVVATINKEDVTRRELLNEIKLAKRKYRIQNKDTLPPGQFVLIKTNSLNELITQTMLLQEAKRLGVGITEQEIKTQLERSQEGYDKEGFLRSLEIEEISMEAWQKKQEKILIIRKLTKEVLNSKIHISDEEVLDYYNKNKEEFQKGEQVRALHIMVATEDEARRVLKFIRKGEDFSQLARDHSLAPEGKAGGDMGFFEAGQMPQGFDDVFKLKEGKVSDIIRTPYGYHIFKVIEKKPARDMNFEESKDEIYKKLLRNAQEQAFQKWVTDIKEKSEIIINYEVLETV